MLAVGEHTLGHVDEVTLKMTNGFAGGIGGSRLGLCGALSAGIMIIGGLHGRTQAGVADRQCRALSARYQERFAEAFGSTCCGDLRPQFESCAALVERAAHILLETIEEA